MSLFLSLFHTAVADQATSSRFIRDACFILGEQFLKALFVSKVGYDLFKLSKAIECAKEEALNYEREDSLTSIFSETSSTDVDGEILNVRKDSEREDDLIIRIDNLEERRRGLLRCCSLSASILALLNFCDRIVEPSGRFLIMLLLVSFWSSRQNALEYIFEYYLTKAFLKVENVMFILRTKLLSRSLSILVRIVQEIIPLLSQKQLEENISCFQEILGELKDELRIKRFQDLKLGALAREKEAIERKKERARARKSII